MTDQVRLSAHALAVKHDQPIITPTRHIRQQHEINRQVWLDRLAQWHPYS